MDNKKYEFLIVGSGAGGATLARELSKRGKEVLVVERGKHEKKIGTFRDALRYFDVNKYTKTPAKSKEGAIMWRTFMAGGSTIVSAGNATRCLEEELSEFGVTLDEEFAEAEKEMGVSTIDEELLSECSQRIRWASEELGYRMELMSKFIDSSKCKKCALCALGCAQGAKWTAFDYLEEAKHNGVEILYNTKVTEVISERGKVRSVRTVGPKGQTTIPAHIVVIAAGGLGTPVILQKSGIKDAGTGLFIDFFVNTYGVTETLSQIHEPSMALVDHEFHKTKGFILSPYLNPPKMVRFMEIGAKGVTLPTSRLVGIMTKITDQPAGRVYPNGSVSKPVTDTDRSRLEEGSSIAKEILVKVGAKEKSIVVSRPQGGHPGGTAAIGKVVGRDLQTRIDNLFVCDASVFPAAPGLPPILTIVALAKHLSKALAP